MPLAPPAASPCASPRAGLQLHIVSASTGNEQSTAKDPPALSFRFLLPLPRGRIRLGTPPRLRPPRLCVPRLRFRALPHGGGLGGGRRLLLLLMNASLLLLHLCRRSCLLLHTWQNPCLIFDTCAILIVIWPEMHCQRCIALNLQQRPSSRWRTH